jgi:predicted NBD/HSP70 family sugar kinase
MTDRSVFQKKLKKSTSPTVSKSDSLLRLIRAAQPIGRTEIAARLGIDKTTLTEYLKPLLKSGFLSERSSEETDDGRKPHGISFANNDSYFVGVNLGVRTTQVGITDFAGAIEPFEDFTTPREPRETMARVRELIEEIFEARTAANCLMIGVCIPGMADVERRKLVYAPNLRWRDVDIAGELGFEEGVDVVVENDSTAAAMFEARIKARHPRAAELSDFVLVRSGTGIGVGLVIGGEIYRGTGIGRGLAGEFGHMTIVAGGKSCVCGNRGCWEKYASAASAATLYLGDRPLRPNESLPRFADIVVRAENGEIRAQRSLEKIGDYLGIGIANVVMGVGIPHVIVSGRLVYGWKFIEKPLRDAINRSIVGSMDGWTIEAGSPVGAAIGGALEVAVDEYLRRGTFLAAE